MGTNSSFPLLSDVEEIQTCLKTIPGTACIASYTATTIVIQLPLCVSIIYLGVRKQRTGAPMSHSDFFTYQIVVAEFLGILGSLAIICGTYNDVQFLTAAGMLAVYCHSASQMSINILNCGDCYLAALYPITYLSLRKAKGTKIRNIFSCLAWLLTPVWTFVAITHITQFPLIYSCSLLCVIIILSFFCGSVLYVLIGPGPGKGGGAIVRVDQTKLRAFWVMVAIIGVLLFKFVGNVIISVLFVLPEQVAMIRCISHGLIAWTCVPSNVLIPLLFIYRERKRTCVKKHKENSRRRN